MIQLIFVLLSSPAFAEVKDSKALFASWERINRPLAGPKAEAIGTYGAGCLTAGEALPLDGKGFAVMRPARLRYYGHPNMLRYIESLAQRMQTEKLPLLLVGDIGRPRGGPMISGHASHQVGLDVDLWFHMARRRPRTAERYHLGAASFVQKQKVTRKWGDKERKLVRLAAEAGEVERIFVNPAIKRDLCEKFPQAPWLYKVRAWWGHADHLHVRLKCPAGSEGCQSQEALNPQEPQCGEALAWWFSPEATEELAAKTKKFAEREFPELPVACARMTEEFHATAPR